MHHSTLLTASLTLFLGAAAAVSAEPPAVSRVEPMKVGPQIQVAPQAPDARSQWSPRVAFDGKDTFLVVWQQGRDLYETETSDIYAARVSADGKALDAKPVAVCTAAESQFGPAVDYADGVFLVAWSDLRNGKDFDVYVARVAPDGKVLDPDGVLLAGGAHNQYGPAVASGDKGFLVVWQDFRDDKGYALYGARVSADGKVLDAGGVPLGGQAKAIRGGSVSAVGAGGAWFVFWRTPEAGNPGAAARIEDKSGALAVAELRGQLPPYSGCMGEPASDGKRVFYAGAAIHGRGGGWRPCTVIVFDAAKCAPLPNPNAKIGGNASGWNEDATICAHIPMPGINAPVTIAHSGGVFLIAARGSSAEKAPYTNQIHAARIGPDGKLIDDPRAWQIIGEGGSPNLAGGKDGSFLLVFASDGRIMARAVGVK